MIVVQKKGIIKKTIVEGSDIIETIGEQILGRSSAEDIIDPETNKVLVKEGSLIDEADVFAIENADIDSIKVKSVLTCEDCRRGLCNLLRQRFSKRY